MHVAVIGAGYWGPNLVRVFSQHRDVAAVTVCEIDPDKRQRIKRLYPTVAVGEDLDAVLSDAAIDAVVVALPASMHYKVTKDALLAGKNVLVEKPLASTVSEAEELCQISERTGKVLMVGHTFLFNAAVRMVKEYIDRGDLGQLYYVYSQRLNLGVVRNDVDALWNLAPHDVSIILYWLDGRLPEEVVYQGACYLQRDIDDVAFLTLRFSDGTMSHIHVSWLDPGKVRRMTVVGSSKMVVYDDVSADAKVQLFDKGVDKERLDVSLGRFDDYAQFQLLQRAGDLLVPRVNFREPLQEEASHFLDCLKNGTKPLTGGSAGVQVVRVLEAASTSRRNMGKPAKV